VKVFGTDLALMEQTAREIERVLRAVPGTSSAYAERVIGGYYVEITPDREAELQRFFDANPAYFVAVGGEPARANEAHEEIHGPLPAGWSYTKKWLIGYLDARGTMVAMANVVTDLLAQGVWHIGLFIVETARHGSGEARTLHRGLEDWARSHGAAWMRLGVVQGNTRAERFWASEGYVQTRTRDGIEMGRRVNTVRVMVKPLAGGTLAAYRALVPRDRPEASATG
ncbi:MAG TPA: GNAT family N-acetyltransferase, partial [Burkholderiaceae bacterium]